MAYFFNMDKLNAQQVCDSKVKHSEISAQYIVSNGDKGLSQGYYKCTDSLYIAYSYERTVYKSYYDSHISKRKVFYKISPNDNFIVNIDQVSHRDIDWITKMQYDRRDRKKYLRVNTILNGLKEHKTLELESERPFMLMLVAHLKIAELEALDLIHWWKTKNKHKRALTVDDTKALRMITKESNKK